MKLSKAVSLNHLYNVTGEIHGNTGMDYRSGFVMHCTAVFEFLACKKIRSRVVLLALLLN